MKVGDVVFVKGKEEKTKGVVVDVGEPMISYCQPQSLVQLQDLSKVWILDEELEKVRKL